MSDETKNPATNAIESSTLLDAINALHEQWVIETDMNRNVEWWSEDEEWARIGEKLQIAQQLASSVQK